MGHMLDRIIYAKEDEIIFTVKKDVQNRFWRYSVEEGQQWTFAYVLPQANGEIGFHAR